MISSGDSLVMFFIEEHGGWTSLEFFRKQYLARFFMVA